MKSLSVCLLLFFVSNIFGQEKLLSTFSLNNSENRIYIIANVYGNNGMLESRIAEKKPLSIYNNIKFSIHNNTSHELEISFNTAVQLIDGSTKTGRIPTGTTLYLAPNGDYPIIDPGDRPGFGRGHLTSTLSYYADVKVNSSEESAETLVIKNISINSLEIIDKTLEREARAKKEAEQKKENDKKETEQKENNDKSTKASQSNSSEKNSTNVDEKNQNVSSNKIKDNSQYKSQQQIDAEAEQAVKQTRQNEYENWKTNAITQRANADMAATAGTMSIMYLLGGFIYKNMGQIPDPEMVYEPSTINGKKLKPRFFLNGQFGYSYSSVPFLYQSKISTMSGGQSIVKYSYKQYEGSFINLGGDFKLGFTSDFYSIYGGLGMIGGITPNMQGSYYGTNLSGGAAIGLKPIKIYGRYKNIEDANYNLKTSNVEEENGIQTKLKSTELEAGIQFTFGGTSNSNFQRTHVYIGMIQKKMPIKNGVYGFEAFYDASAGVINRAGNLLIKGYNFEIRKDHSFNLFMRYFPEHYFYGNVNDFNAPYGYIQAKLDKPFAASIEIGFYRCIDLFN